MTEPVFYGLMAVLSAAGWALCGILWRKLGDDLSPASMNFAKVTLGSCMLAVILPFVGIPDTSLADFLLLGVSGLLGIAIGDTCFYISLLKLGPRRASLLGTLNPVLIALASFLFLHERPSAWAWTGIVVTSLGVTWVLYERIPRQDDDLDLKGGVFFGCLSILCTSTSILLAKVALTSTPSVQAALIRLTWAAAGFVAWGMLRGKLREWSAAFRDRALFARVLLVVLVAVFGGFWLSLVALKHIDASIAGTLNSTAPLLILPMVVLILKEKVSPRAVLGALVAVGGIALILADQPDPRPTPELDNPPPAAMSTPPPS